MKTLTIKKAISLITSGKRIYAKKDRSYQKIYMWLESKSDGWFINIETELKNKKNDSIWITKKQLQDKLNFLNRENYKFYLDE